LNGDRFFSIEIVVGRSTILREKLEASLEEKNGKVVLSLELEASLKALDTFFRFIYTGKLKETLDDDGVDPAWVQMLPELVDLAHKVSEQD